MEYETPFAAFAEWYTLNLVLDKGTKEMKFSFNEYLEMHDYIERNIAIGEEVMQFDRVYLYRYGGIENPIIISCNPFHILTSHSDKFGFREHHIYEFKSYEDAYEEAKHAMRNHKLCYSKPKETEDTMEIAKRIEERLKQQQILEKHNRRTKHIIQYEINDMLGLKQKKDDQGT